MLNNIIAENKTNFTTACQQIQTDNDKVRVGVNNLVSFLYQN